MYYLFVREKSKVISEFLVKKSQVSIGSDTKCDICLSHKMISPTHCQIVQDKQRNFVVTDLKSTFGLFLNNKKIVSSEFKFGDVITLGPFGLEFIPVESKNKKAENRYCLISINGSLFGNKYMLHQTSVRIGRDPLLNDIVLPEEGEVLASRRHATVVKIKKGYVLTDKRSKNRTKVNRKTLNEDDEILLQPNDEVVIGKHIFRFTNATETRILPPVRTQSFVYRITKFLLIRFPIIVLSLFALSAIFSGIQTYRFTQSKLKNTEFKSIESISNGKDKIQSIVIPENQRNTSLLLRKHILDINNFLGMKLYNPNSINLVFLTENGGIFKWGNEIGFNNIFSSFLDSSTYPMTNDFNNDSIIDVALHAQDSRVYIIDGKSKQILYKSQILGKQTNSSPLFYKSEADENNIISCTDNGIINFIFNPIYNKRILTKTVLGKIYSSPVLIDYKGLKQLLICSHNGNLYFYSTMTGNIQKEIDLTANLYINSPLVFTATPANGDINNDGLMDIVTISNSGYIFAVDYESGRTLWKPFKPDNFKSQNDTSFQPSCVLTDIDKDKILDIVIASVNGKIYGIKGSTGKILFEKTLLDNAKIYSNIALADFDRDRTNELIINTSDGKLLVYAIESEHPLFVSKVSNNSIIHSPLVADADTDGFLEIIQSTNAGGFKLIHTNTPCFPGEVIWSTLHGKTSHNGTAANHGKDLAKISFNLLYLGIIYIIALSLILFIKKPKRRLPCLI